MISLVNLILVDCERVSDIFSEAEFKFPILYSFLKDYLFIYFEGQHVRE